MVRIQTECLYCSIHSYRTVGFCIGGGVDVVSAADIRIASDDARFSVKEVSR